MRTRFIQMITVLFVTVALCVFSNLYIGGVITQIDEMRVASLVYVENNKREEASAKLTEMLTVYARHAPYLEIFAPHDDLHEMMMHLTDAQSSLEIDDMDDFLKAMSLFSESIQHIRDHEMLLLSNIL